MMIDEQAKHNRLVKYYSILSNIDFIDDKIIRIYSEVDLYKLFGIDSRRQPDLIYINDTGLVYVGEIKSTNTKKRRKKARKQVRGYSNILTDWYIDNIPFIIVDYYREILV